MADLRFLTLHPGHFHAALVQKEMYEGVNPCVHVFAPLGSDLGAHVQRIIGFNTRRHHPTDWRLEVHASSDYLERFSREKPGEIAVLSGRNANKIGLVQAALDAGLHVLADKPWILTPADLPRLETALETAAARGLVAYDIMTERHEITSILQRELIQDEALFGTIVPGTRDEPGILLESVHSLKKTVAGVPLRRPVWFFDIHQQGEGLSDVGTHLVDLIPWILFPGQTLEWRRDLRLLAGRRWPTTLTPGDFQQVTGEAEFVPDLAPWVQGGRLDYYCNTQVQYQLRDIHIQLDVLWNCEAAAGAGDTHKAIFRGSKANVEVRQGQEENYQPELYFVPNVPAASLQSHLEKRLALLQAKFPGLGLRAAGPRFRVEIPQRHRLGHEAHFCEVTQQFLRYVRKQDSLPAWEKPNMLAKYYVTTGGVELAKKTP